MKFALISLFGITVYQLCLFARFGVDLSDEAYCEDVQYLILGKSGVITCDFGETFYSVLWYNTSNTEESQPVLYYTEREPSGVGYESGEFNISTNGSLIINKVSLSHDDNFTAVFIDTTLRTETTLVRVVVTVKPSQEHPLITRCGGERFCFSETVQSTELSCYIHGVRPPLELTLMKVTTEGALPLQTIDTHILQITLYTSTSTVSLPIQQPTYFQALVCRALEPPKLLTYNTSIILIQSGPIDIKTTDLVTVYGEQYTDFVLDCSSDVTSYVVWRKRMTDNSIISVAEAVFFENAFVRTSSKRYDILETYHSLVIHTLDIQDEGVYSCIFGNGFEESIKLFDVKVYVPPNPPYLSVDGCNPNQHCTLTANSASSEKMKCSLTGIRPEVDLLWTVVDKAGVEELSTSRSKISRDGKVYDVTLTTEYRLTRVKEDRRVTFECSMVTNDSFPIRWSTTVDLLVLEDVTTTKPEELNGGPINVVAIVIAVTVFVVILIIVVFLAHASFRRKVAGCLRRDTVENVEKGADFQLQHEIAPLLLTQSDLRRQLRTHYQEKCAGVERLPKTATTKIENFFVESNLEILISKHSNDWKKLDSYHEIIDTEHKRVLLEGGTGYGKSILCLKMAHDWCTGNTSSPLKDVDIFILLHMRHIRHDISLYQAIKQNLLPKDSKVTTEEIKNTITSSQSVVITLDGFNRYPRKDNYEETEYKEIMMKQILQNCTVIITTTPKVLPTKLPNRLKRIRLGGFDEKTQNKYISEVVVKKDGNERDRIKQLLDSIPGTFAFCQIPLFFTLLAHLAHEGKLSKQVSANTVTECFQCIINALTKEKSHQRGDRSRKEDVDYNEPKLYSEAFDALCRTSKGLVWETDKLKDSVGHELYNEFIRIGILVEEEMLTELAQNEEISYITMSSFYHNVFCEWFAAQHLAGSKAWSDSMTEKLKRVHPIDHQYVFRFACGLNRETAEGIINYMKTIEDGDAFAKMCILEQKGGISGIDTFVRNICSTPVIISSEQSKLLQRTNTQLLVLASDNKIPIEIVWLNNTNAYYNTAAESLSFSSGIKLPKLETLTLLSIAEAGKEYTNEQLAGIFEYACICTDLKELRFRGVILPYEIQRKVLKKLHRRAIVDWMLPIEDKPVYHLDVQRGQWQLNGERLAFSLYKSVKKRMQVK